MRMDEKGGNMMRHVVITLVCLLVLISFQGDAEARRGDSSRVSKSAKNALKSALRQKDVDYRIAMLKKVVEKNPKTEYACKASLELGKLYLINEDLSQAENYLTSAAEGCASDDHCAEGLYYLSGIHLKNGEKDKALESLEAIIKKYPASSYFDPALAKLKTVYASNGIGVQAADKKGQGFFSVQVGSYTKKSNAEKVVSRLKGNYTVTMSKIHKSGKIFYRVRIGEYNTRKEALEVARLIKKSEGFPAVVVP